MYSIKPLESSRIADALQFVCNEFVTESVVHHAVGIGYGEYIEYMREPFTAMATAGLSFIAEDNDSNNIVGCLLAGDFNETYGNAAPVPAALAPVKALLSELEQPYRKMKTSACGKILLVDVATVSVRARNQGLYRRLRLAAHEAGRDKGFSSVVGELSSTPTQRFCVDTLGQMVVNEVKYADFLYDGDYPFATINQPPAIQLVEGQLSDVHQVQCRRQ